ncbi:hypothetical protein U1Q18_011762 [Sarracenia purpurea var. burkii]
MGVLDCCYGLCLDVDDPNFLAAMDSCVWLVRSLLIAYGSYFSRFSTDGHYGSFTIFRSSLVFGWLWRLGRDRLLRQGGYAMHFFQFPRRGSGGGAIAWASKTLTGLVQRFDIIVKISNGYPDRDLPLVLATFGRNRALLHLAFNFVVVDKMGNHCQHFEVMHSMESIHRSFLRQRQN